MLRTLFMLVVVACLTKTSNSYYTIVGPSYIQSDSTYSVAVVWDETVSTSISLTIQNDNGFSVSQSVTVPAQSSQIVDFSIGSLDGGNYKFVATGQNGYNFVNETTLTFQTKRKSVFIQSDKAMYKPGDKVQFRVIVVDKDLNPAPINNLDIYITDASQNRVDQWLGASVTMGVYIGELQLASTPCLGEWRIHVDVDDESSEKAFEVAEYVLPKFEVTVQAPKDATYADGTLLINIKALYTYGESVKGVAQVTISRYYSWDPTPQLPIVQKQVDINGNAVASFQMETELKITSQNWQDDFKVTVSVTEALTGVVLEGLTTVSIRRSKFTVANLDTDLNYEPGPYTLSLQFSYYDGSPYSDSVNTIKVSYGSNYDKTNSVDLGTGNIGADGVANIPINLPDLADPFFIFIQFLDFYDSVGQYQKVQPSQPTDENSLSVRLLTKNTKIDDNISVEVSSVNDLSSVAYLLTARGNLILSETKQVASGKSVEITFKASFAMVPRTQFVAYYITSTGDIVAGRTEILVNGLNNFVTIKTSDAEKQPGESVGITISSKPLSQICLLGIDQSVALLGTGNDFQQSEVYLELGKYTTSGGGGGPIFFNPGPVFVDDNQGTTLGAEDLTTTGSADETTTASADETTTASADGTTTASADVRTTGSADETTTGSADETTTGSADGTTTGSVDETTTGSADETTTGSADETTTGSADETTWGPEDLTTVDPNLNAGGRPNWWGGSGSRFNFGAAGLFLLTDCNEDQIFYYPWFEFANFGDAPMMTTTTFAPTSTEVPSTGSEASSTVRKYFPETWIWECNTVRRANAGGEIITSTAVPSMGSAQTATVRKYFPETWIWECDTVSSGSLTLNEKAPDTITSWYLTGFATNNQFGLGVTEDKTVFKVFKKFFISLNLPYSVKRGEAALLQIVIFNYLPKNVTTKVTLDNSLKQFEFVDPNTQAYKDKGCPLAIDGSRSKTVTVNANDGISLSFLITPLIIGPMLIKVAATSPVAGDAIEVPLLVVAEGVTQYKNKAKFVDLRSNKIFTTDLTVDVPKNAVPDSTKVQISAIGDVLGPALQNIDSLIQMPCGCGEQTMLGLAPDVVIYDYLVRANLLTPALKTKLLNFMRQGYQGELSYQHDDNSFSAFGNSDSSGSSWLTAFVARIFIQAKPYITIDNNVIINALAWLAGQQQPDGRFNEPGNVCHSDMQGEASKGVALTSYIVVTFLADPAIAQLYAGVIASALNYIYQTLLTLDDLYSLAIAAYAAQLANYEHKGALLQKLDSLSKVQGDQKWWEKVQLATPTDPWSGPPSVNVEITGYALLAYIVAGRALDGLPITKWLIAQQSASGGFKSTQDTVVGITALATFASTISGSNVMACTFIYASSSKIVNIDKTNSLVLQSFELPSTTQSVKVTCEGSGFSLVQLSYQFNLNDAEASPRFVLNVDVDKKSNDFSLVLNICTSFIAGNDSNTTNMALIEAELPSGFTADLQTTKNALASVKGFKRVETRNGNTIIVIYLDNLSTTTVCLQVMAYRVCQIADEKPVAVIVLDYYRSDRRKTVFYSRTPTSVCSLCDNDECKAACKKPAKDVKCPKKQTGKGSNKVAKIIENLLRKIRARFW